MNHSDIEHMAQGYPPSHIGKDCEEVITWLATQLLANQEQRDGLAAENAALISAFMPKEIPTEATDNFSDTAVLRIDGDEFHSWQWVDNQDEVIRGVLNFFKPKTPTTDAYLNSVRADVIKQLHSEQKEWALVTWQYDSFDALKRAAVRHGDSELSGVIFMLDRIEGFASQLRAGKDGE
jgi:hypothetical protein